MMALAPPAASASPLVSNSGSGGAIGLVAPSLVSSSLSSMKSSLPKLGGGNRLRLISTISVWIPGVGVKPGGKTEQPPVSGQPLMLLLAE